MDNYESRPLLPMPFPKKLKEMTDEELTKLLTGNFNYNVLIPGLIEAILRKDKQIAELTKRISYLEKKTLQKPGRKRNPIPYQGQELTGELLMKLIDEGYYRNISQMEKDLQVGKNVLRNRYYKAKEKLRLKRRIDKYGDC